MWSKYKVEYNPVSKTYCLYQQKTGIEKLLFQDINKQIVEDKCNELLQHQSKRFNQISELGKKGYGRRAVYKLYLNGTEIDTGTQDELINRHPDLSKTTFLQRYYFYKKRADKVYFVERIGFKAGGEQDGNETKKK